MDQKERTEDTKFKRPFIPFYSLGRVEQDEKAAAASSFSSPG